jgi:hypothetical protein
LGRAGDVALDSKLLWEHFGKPDDWDPVFGIFPITDEEGKKGTRVLKVRDMFPYI